MALIDTGCSTDDFSHQTGDTRMFKKPLLAAAIFGVIAASIGCTQSPPAAPDTAADQAKLQADALIWFEYYAKGDADGMANLYAEDALLMPPGAAAVTGRPAIKAFLGEDAAKAKAAGISLKNSSVTGAGIDGDSGWVSGTYLVVDASGATIDSGSYLSVHRRTNGAWLYIRDIWNSDRPPAPPAPAPKVAG
jgi:ketosteroid isomerase-like protein